jgi:hypothetical protein
MVLKTGHFKKYIKNTWMVLKRGAGEGWKRSVGAIVCEMKKYHKESKRQKTSYIQ